MRPITLLPRLWLPVLLTLLAAPLPGCFEDGHHTPVRESFAANALRRSFPAHAGEVLDLGEGFVVTERGFALGKETRPAEARPGLDVELPRSAEGVIRFRGAGGAEITVRERGIEGAGELVEHAVVYRRAGGMSFWAAVPRGVEEWLHLEAGVARAGEAVASWEVEGASVRQRGEAVELVDEAGWARLRVTAPVAYASSGREVKARLEGRTGRVDLYVEASGEALLVDPIWSLAGVMNAARIAHSATLLGSGEVLVVGGQGGVNGNSNVLLDSVELYNPALDTWTATGQLLEVRGNHTATLLGDGKVLVVGGRGNGGALASAELYDPITALWTAAGSISMGRAEHTATLLVDGKVLVAGGVPSQLTDTSLPNVDLYDPASNTWTQVASMPSGVSGHTATRLSNGSVLVAGGADGNGIAKEFAYLYDPESGAWTSTGALMTTRSGHTATRLGNGKVLVTGGSLGNGLASAELYDPTTALWTTTGSMIAARYGHTATLLPNGEVLVTGGHGDLVYHASAEIYEGGSGLWTPAGSMSVPRLGHVATLLGSGEVLVAGGVSGYNSPPLASAEIDAPFASSPCLLDTECQSGFCADGVCCDTACNAGACDACSIAAGATTDGVCALLTGPACEDGDGCTHLDTCQAGSCLAGALVVCAPLDSCHVAGACDSTTGICSDPSQPNTTPCPGGACAEGVCVLDSPSGAGGSGGAMGSGGNGGATGSSGVTSSGGAMSSGGVTATSSGMGMSSGSGAGGSGGQGDSSGDGCVYGGGRGAAGGALWIGLGLLLARRRRRSSPGAARALLGSCRARPFVAERAAQVGGALDCDAPDVLAQEPRGVVVLRAQPQ